MEMIFFSLLHNKLKVKTKSIGHYFYSAERSAHPAKIFSRATTT